MSHSVTVHLAVSNIEDVVSVLREYCGVQFARQTEADWEAWAGFVFGIDVAVYESGDFVDVPQIPFSRYAVVISLAASHASDRMKEFMKAAAILLAEVVGARCSAAWIVVVESARVVARSDGGR